MANSKLIDLTAADSGDLVDPSSVFFLAILPDDTPVSIPGSELRKRISSKKGTYLYTETDQAVRNDGAAQIVSVDSNPIYNVGSWWDPQSPNIFMSPDDSVEWAQCSLQQTWTNGGGAADVQIYVTYTSVTSTKYNRARPVIGDSSYVTHIGLYSGRVVSGNHYCFDTFHTQPFYVESGDQFMFQIVCNHPSTPSLVEFWWSINPVKLRT